MVWVKHKILLKFNCCISKTKTICHRHLKCRDLTLEHQNENQQPPINFIRHQYTGASIYQCSSKITNLWFWLDSMSSDSPIWWITTATIKQTKCLTCASLELLLDWSYDLCCKTLQTSWVKQPLVLVALVGDAEHVSCCKNGKLHSLPPLPH